jgi:hypothetical protein
VRSIRPRLSYANVGTTVALVLAGTGFAVASIPGGRGVISACYGVRGGSLRIIDTARKRSAGHCQRGERLLTWNRTGPVGVPGARGLQGKTGPSGPGASRIYEKLGAFTDSAPTKVLTLDGLTLTLSCFNEGSIALRAALDAASASAAKLQVTTFSDGGGSNPTQTESATASNFEVSTFPASLFVDATANSGAFERTNATLVYYPTDGSHVVTVQLSLFSDFGIGLPQNEGCYIEGTAVPS